MAKRKTLTVAEILAWADEHHERTGKYPHCSSGSLPGQPAETWHAINQALAKGGRGLPGGDSLACLLHRERGHRHKHQLPLVNEDAIVAWARAHLARTGSWPGVRTGPVEGAPGEVWQNIDRALRHGSRGLPGGDSLARLLGRKRGEASSHFTDAFRVQPCRLHESIAICKMESF